MASITVEEINSLIRSLTEDDTFEDITTQINFYLGEELDFANISVGYEQNVKQSSIIDFSDIVSGKGITSAAGTLVLKKQRVYCIEADIVLSDAKQGDFIVQFKDISTNTWIGPETRVYNFQKNHIAYIFEADKMTNIALVVKYLDSKYMYALIDYKQTFMTIHEVSRAQLFATGSGGSGAGGWFGVKAEYDNLVETDDIAENTFYIVVDNADTYLYYNNVLLNYPYANKDILRMLSTHEGKLLFNGKPIETDLSTAVTDYLLAINKPKINNVELINNKSFRNLGLYMTSDSEAELIISELLE